MDTPLLNFVGAIGIGLVIGIIGALVLRSRNAGAIWMAPVLGMIGSLIASVLALFIGDRNDYGWKEMALQVILAIVGVGVSAMGARSATA